MQGMFYRRAHFLYHCSVLDENIQRSLDGGGAHNLSKFGQLKCVTLGNLEQEIPRLMYCLLCQGTIHRVHYPLQQRSEKM